MEYEVSEYGEIYTGSDIDVLKYSEMLKFLFLFCKTGMQPTRNMRILSLAKKQMGFKGDKHKVLAELLAWYKLHCSSHSSYSHKLEKSCEAYLAGIRTQRIE